jgi:hypothetical protein
MNSQAVIHIPETIISNIPPHSEAVEKSVLGSVIISPTALDGVCRMLSGEHFYIPVHRRIFETILDMNYHGEPIDVVTLSERLPGNEALISEMVEGDTATHPHVSGHAKILDKKLRLRRLREKTILLQQAISIEDIEQVGRLQQEIAGITKVKNPSWNPQESSPRRFFDSEPKPFEFIVPGLLSKGLVGFLYGQGGSYKSIAALWLCIQRAIGNLDCQTKWLDKFEVTPGKSIFFSAEELETDLHHRVKSIVDCILSRRPELSRQAVYAAINENLLIISREQWTGDGEQFLIDSDGRRNDKVEEIISLIKNHNADLAVFETSSRLFPVDENSNRDGALMVGVLEYIRDMTGASILVIDHTCKMAREFRGDIQGQNGLRGASAKLDNARFGMWFRTLPAKEGQDVLEIINSKTFRCRRVDPFKVKIEYPAFLQCEDAEVIMDVFDLVVGYVRTNPGTKQRMIREGVNKGAIPVNRALKDAINEGIIELRGNKNKPEGYFYVDN